MKIAKQIPAYLIGITFLVFSLNFGFHFIPMASPTGNAATFMSVIYPSGFLTFVKVIELVSSILLLINKKTQPLALLLISPIIVGITAYEVFIVHQPGLGVVLLIIDAIAIIINHKKYLPIIQ